MDERFVLGADAGQIVPEFALDAGRGFAGRGEKVGVLEGEFAAEILFGRCDAVLERVLKIGGRAREVRFVDDELVLPFGPPGLPVCVDVADLLDGRIQGGNALTGGVGERGQRAVDLVEGFQRGVQRAHGFPVEIHLVANEPGERAGNRPLARLDECVDGTAGPRIDGADGGHLGLRGVAGLQQRCEIGKGQVDGAAGGGRVTGADAFANLRDQMGQFSETGIVRGGRLSHACGSGPAVWFRWPGAHNWR